MRVPVAREAELVFAFHVVPVMIHGLLESDFILWMITLWMTPSSFSVQA